MTLFGQNVVAADQISLEKLSMIIVWAGFEVGRAFNSPVLAKPVLSSEAE
jgi:hypothetical protein